MNTPQQIQAHLQQAIALHQQGRFAEAERAYRDVLDAAPQHLDALNNLAFCLQDLNRPADALAAFDRVIALKPDFANAYIGRGNALQALGRPQEALASYDACAALAPAFAVAHLARAGVLMQLQRFQDAVPAFESALKLEARDVAAWLGHGQALLALTRAKDALRSFDQATTLAPNSAEAHLARAGALSNLKRMEEALHAIDRALALNPNLAAAYELRGFARLDMKQYEQAAADLQRALAAGPPSWELAPGAYLQACVYLCRWDEIDAHLPSVTAAIKQGKRACQPFPLQCVSDDPARLLQSARSFAPPPQRAPVLAPRFDDPAIRVAYFSSDFHDHPVSHLIAGLMEEHDRARCHVTAFSFGLRHDDWSERIAGAADAFIGMKNAETDEIIRAAREERFDIAVDLNGFTTGCRPAIFAARVAPVQINYLGFLGTMGAPYMDYIVADEAIVSPEDRAHYAEKIISLPWYQCNEGQGQGAAPAVSRAAYGLPDDAFVFCSFNNNAKITRDTFALWMRILQRTPGAVLWLYANTAPAQHFMDEAALHGIDPSRIIFATRVPLAEHMARLGLANLALDTFPYNGGATGANMLEANVPVLTLRGRSFQSRMGASLLRTVSADQLITETPQAYEDLAVRLASDPALLAEHRRALGANAAQKLFNIEAFARNIEAAYERAVERTAKGEAPDHITIR